MKVNKKISALKINIMKILITYFSLFIVLFLALYLMMPFYFNIYIVSLNMAFPSLVLFIALFLIYKNSKKTTIKACDSIYFICKKAPIFLHFITMLFSGLIDICFKSKTSLVITAIAIFAETVFYIFSQRFFKEILNYSETNLRGKSNSLVKNDRFLNDLPYSVNLLLEILPLIISNLLISISLTPITINSGLYMLSLLIISILAIIYIALDIYLNITNISVNALDVISTLDTNLDKKTINTNLNYNNEIGSLIYKINTTKQLYDDYINELKEYQTLELEQERLSSIEIIRRTVDAKDTYTRGHSDRVSKYSVLIGKHLNLTDSELKTLEIGGLFHDIGKIGIPDRVLLKDGKLTDEEYDEIKKHPSIGAHILENSKIFESIIPIVLHHHEKYDGTGYPAKLKGNDIPYLARIVAIADTFDAMTSKRVYRNSLPLEVVKDEFKKCSASQFDPDIAKVFLDILNNHYEEIEQIMKL